ncbi:unnamed protein product [Blepharisma stoltei]|uniref:Transmembrane protein 230 n=1 Tax=Blepharisma stoltei TaxID=1481888 RepID=A0AAU9KHI0_9CILI|nr:unnamed protein product [Blepharisma stoltei]
MNPQNDSFDIMAEEHKDKSSPEEIPGLKVDDIHFGIMGNDEYVAPFPKKTLYCSIALFIVGSVLVIVGCVELLVVEDKTNGLALLIIGAIAFIPGMYYSYIFYKLYRAKTQSERMRILREIPEM